MRDDEDYFEDIGDVKVSGEMLDLAEHIIDKKLTSFDPTRFEDRYQNALVDLIKAKSGHRAAPKVEAPSKPSNVINLMDALKKSIAAEKQADKPASRPARAAANTASRGATKKSAPAAKGKAAAKNGSKRLKKAS